MARTPKYTDEEIIKALTASKGLVYVAAARVGCDPDTIYNRIKTRPAVAACLKLQRGKLVDNAEDRLFRAVNRDEAWAITMVLKNLGKDRGYTERTESETTIKGNVDLNHGINDPGEALAPYLSVLKKFLAGQGSPALPPEVPGKPVGEAKAAPEAGGVPPA